MMVLGGKCGSHHCSLDCVYPFLLGSVCRYLLTVYEHDVRYLAGTLDVLFTDIAHGYLATDAGLVYLVVAHNALAVSSLDKLRAVQFELLH